jgi:AcrR family transcriptional regulator
MSLFAKEGVQAVTLRRISAEAGSANTAVVHYYFKNKTGLLCAIVEMLEEAIWQPAFKRLEHASAADITLRNLIDIGLWPYKRPVLELPWGGDAQAFSFHLKNSGDEVAKTALAAVSAPFDELFKSSARSALRDLSESVFEQRWQFMMTEAIAGQWVRAKVLDMAPETVAAWTPDLERQYLELYLDYVVGGLMAPLGR